MRTLLFSAKILLIALALTVYGCSSRAKSGENDDRSIANKSGEKWIQLFNGQDLNDWQPKFKGHELGVNYNNTFRVENGLLRVRYDDWETFGEVYGHLFYKGEFSHYRLRAVYRFVDDQVKNGPGWAYRNNGIMIHGQPAESMELNQNFPVSVEVQLLGGSGSGERPTMNLCTPGTNVVMDGELVERHCTSSGSKTYHGDQWVSVEVEVRGGEVIRHFVDGEEVMHYEKPQLDPKDESYEKLLPADGNKILSKGTISIQAESHPTDFRKIELLILEE